MKLAMGLFESVLWIWGFLFVAFVAHMTVISIRDNRKLRKGQRP